MNDIILKDVTKIYRLGEHKITAAGGISFDIKEGEFTVIVGPSGAGKTTVLNLLGGMDTCDSGSILVGDEDISKYSEKQLTRYRRNDVGFVFQFYNLMQNLTALENVELASEICKDHFNAKEMLEKVGLSHRLDNFPAQLSGGEQQRVSIARALAKNPKLLLCDEPTGALDYQTGKGIMKILQEACLTQKKTIIVVTHNAAIAKIAHKVIHIKNGLVSETALNGNPADAGSLEW